MEISGMFLSVSTACFTCPTILVCYRRNPPLKGAGDGKQSDRPHMIYNNISLHGIKPENTFCIFVCTPRMGHSVKMVACFFRVGMPVIQKQIMKHAGSGRRPCIQPEKFTPLVIIICHIHAVLIAVCTAVVRISLHSKHRGMLCNICDFPVEFILPASAHVPKFFCCPYTESMYHVSVLLVTVHSVHISHYSTKKEKVVFI